MYEVLIEKRAERDLKRLSPALFNAIINRILALKQNPRPHGARKIVGSKNDWRLRVSKYRIIYEVCDKEKKIKVFRVKHRKEVYR